MNNTRVKADNKRMKLSDLRALAKTSLFIWLLIGIVIRLLLSAFTLHPDIWALTLTPHFLVTDGVWNIYDYLSRLTPETSEYARTLGTNDVFIYPPLTYFTLGFFQFLFMPFIDQSFYGVVAAKLGDTIGDSRLYWYLFFGKLPYLFFDLGALYFMYNMFQDHVQQKWAFFLWLFNPITLYATYMGGNFDIIPTFFTVMAMYFLLRKRNIAGFLSFGVGAAYKTYPILIALPLVLALGRNVKERILYGVLLIGPYLLSSLPFITTPGYKTNVLINPKNTKFLHMGWPVSGAEVVYVFIFVVVIIAFIAVWKRIIVDDIWMYPLAILLTLFSVTHYHPQWMIWVTPFIIFLFILKPWSRWPIAVLLGCFFGVTLLFEASLSVQLFAPLFPALASAPGLVDILTAKQIDDFQLRSLLRSVSAGTSAVIVYRLLSISNGWAMRDGCNDIPKSRKVLH